MSVSDAIVERMEAEVQCLRDELQRQTERAEVAEEALRVVSLQQPETIRWFRANGVVFNGPLDFDTTNWQSVAFFIYNDLCSVDTIARNALAGDE